MDLTEDYRNDVGRKLTVRIGEAIRDNLLPMEQIGSVCDFILERIDKTKSHEELVEFLKELVRKWDFFDQILTSELSEQSAEADKRKISEISQLISDKKFDEAITKAEPQTKTG